MSLTTASFRINEKFLEIILISGVEKDGNVRITPVKSIRGSDRQVGVPITPVCFTTSPHHSWVWSYPADDLAGNAVVFVACRLSGWRHVWLPIGVFGWFLRVHHRGEYLTGQEAGSTT
jgi:hypothetical protein